MKEKINDIVEIAKKIMDQTFEYAVSETVDDVELIKEIKRIISGCQTYCKKDYQVDDDTKWVVNTLKLYGQEQYMKMWEKSIDEDEQDSFDAIMKEGLETYNYLFKYEERK